MNEWIVVKTVRCKTCGASTEIMGLQGCLECQSYNNCPYVERDERGIAKAAFPSWCPKWQACEWILFHPHLKVSSVKEASER